MLRVIFIARTGTCNSSKKSDCRLLSCVDLLCVYRSPHLKQMGVTVLPELPEVEEGEPQPVLQPEQTEVDPGKLLEASKDILLNGVQAWRPVTSTKSHNLRNKAAGIESVRWPGAVAITDGSSWMNVYVGWGLKRTVGANSSRAAESAPVCAVMQPLQPLPAESTQLPPPPVKEEEAEEE
jgi:hypothetical protein